jgi:hypothetical protein
MPYQNAPPPMQYNNMPPNNDNRQNNQGGQNRNINRRRATATATLQELPIMVQYAVQVRSAFYFELLIGLLMDLVTLCLLFLSLSSSLL